MLADRVLLGQRFDPSQGLTGAGQQRLLLGQVGLGTVQRGLKRFGVELEQQLPGFDQTALDVGDLVEIALDQALISTCRELAVLPVNSKVAGVFSGLISTTLTGVGGGTRRAFVRAQRD